MVKDIFVTGMGIISGIGENVDKTRTALLNEQSGIGKLRYLQTALDLPCAEVPHSDKELCEELSIPFDTVITRTTLLGIKALKEALQQAKLQIDGRQRIAFISGTTVGGMEKSEMFYRDFLGNDTQNAYIAAHDCGACTEQIGDYFGKFSAMTTISTACSSAANAIILGANLLKLGLTDIAVVGGSECLTKFHLNGFNTLMILDKQPCRPFDATRAGLNLGEGAAYLVLESKESANQRQVSPIAQISGYGNACDAFHQTASSPDGKGAVLAMKKALNMAHLKSDEISYINAHGTGTPNNDISEGQAILTVFGKENPPFSSTKSATGHTTSASGSIEAVISILAIQHGLIPANLNYAEKIPELPITPIKKVLINQKVNHVMSNSFGFGGNNSTVIFSKIQL